MATLKGFVSTMVESSKGMTALSEATYHKNTTKTFFRELIGQTSDKLDFFQCG